MRGLILLGGEAPGLPLLSVRFAWADVVIAADGGLRYAVAHDLVPHIAVGDFDSIDSAPVEDARKLGCDVRVLPREKDQTDGQEALDILLDRGCTEIALLGGYGGRLDHQLAHLCLLVRALRRGVRAWMEREGERAECFGQGIAHLRGMKGDTVSILPFGDGLWVERVGGMQYPIPDKAMPLDVPYGVSNVMTQEHAFIAIRSGVAIVTQISAAPC